MFTCMCVCVFDCVHNRCSWKRCTINCPAVILNMATLRHLSLPLPVFCPTQHTILISGNWSKSRQSLTRSDPLSRMLCGLQISLIFPFFSIYAYVVKVLLLLSSLSRTMTLFYKIKVTPSEWLFNQWTRNASRYRSYYAHCYCPLCLFLDYPQYSSGTLWLLWDDFRSCQRCH